MPIQPTVSTATSVSLINRALIALGDAPITALDDGSVQAAVASQIYAPALEEFVSATGWRWAMKAKPVTPHTYGASTYVPADSRYSFEYVLPSDFLSLYRTDPPCLHELAVAQDGANVNNFVRVLWTNVTINRIYYSGSVDESMIPPYAQETFVYKLAHQMAIAIQANRSRAEYFYELYMRSLRRAQAIDARQRPTASVVENGRLSIEWDEI